MDIELKRKEKDLLEFKIKGERHSIPNLLKQKLIENKKVEFVSYKLEHPTDNDAMFILKTKGIKPGKAVQQACKELINQFSELKKEAKKLK